MTAQQGKPLAALQQALPGRVRVDRDTLYLYSFDSMKVSFLPEAVIQPAEVAEVGKVLELANRFSIPVTPRGAGSSRTAGAAPRQGGWVLDLQALQTLEIDAEQGLAKVGAGVITADLQARAEAVDWYYPPDPSSRKYSTIGGNIACNAGGLRGAKYGVTRDYVMALSGFLPTGEWVQWGRDTRKFASGFNLRDLWIGSEGLLGVVTEATLRLVPKPESKWTFLAAFADEPSALKAIQKLLKVPLVPAICEFMDRNAVRGAEIFQERPVFPGLENVAVVLLELDGKKIALQEEKKVVLDWAATEALRFHEATSAEESETLWQTRRSCSPAMYRLADSKLNEDIVVPLKNLEPLMSFVRELEEKSGLPIATFGHAADGNLHVNIIYHQKDSEERKQAFAAVEALLQEVVRLGGAISGEHGIGLGKSPFLRLQFSDAEIQAMQRIKSALDPKGILNPGKIFQETRLWEYDPVDYTFPWDQKG